VRACVCVFVCPVCARMAFLLGGVWTLIGMYVSMYVCTCVCAFACVCACVPVIVPAWRRRCEVRSIFCLHLLQMQTFACEYMSLIMYLYVHACMFLSASTLDMSILALQDQHVGAAGIELDAKSRPGMPWSCVFLQKMIQIHRILCFLVLTSKHRPETSHLVHERHAFVMSVHVCIRECFFVPLSLHARTQIIMQTDNQIDVNVCKYVCIYIYIYIYMHISKWSGFFSRIHVHTPYTHVRIRCIRLQEWTLYTRIRTHTHTHTQVLEIDGKQIYHFEFKVMWPFLCLGTFVWTPNHPHSHAA
jgi:hypothetical protein